MWTTLSRLMKGIVIGIASFIVIGIFLGNWAGFSARSNAADVATAVETEKTRIDNLVIVVDAKADEAKVRRSFADMETVNNAKYLSKADAAATYLSKADAAATYLTTTDAAATYLTTTDADAIKADISANIAAIDAINGKVVSLDKSKASYGWAKKTFVPILADKEGNKTLDGFAKASELDSVWDRAVNNTERIEKLENAPAAPQAPVANECQEGTCGVVIDVPTDDAQ